MKLLHTGMRWTSEWGGGSSRTVADPTSTGSSDHYGSGHRASEKYWRS
jgi:hypothetical protein